MCVCVCVYVCVTTERTRAEWRSSYPTQGKLGVYFRMSSTLHFGRFCFDLRLLTLRVAFANIPFRSFCVRFASVLRPFLLALVFAFIAYLSLPH
jgi:hypothetical protein